MTHIMTITDGVPVFTCTSPADAKCHQYPDCGCDYWSDDHEHPAVTQPTCWLADWYSIGTNATVEMYGGPAAETNGVGIFAMPQNAQGEITVEFDESPIWSFTDLIAALAASAATEGALS